MYCSPFFCKIKGPVLFYLPGYLTFYRHLVYNSNMEEEKISAAFLKNRLEGQFKEKKVKLAYLFGSSVSGRTGPMSDIDIAVLFYNEVEDILSKTLELSGEVKEILGTEKIDLGNLDRDNLSFCYNVIKTGKCIFGEEEDRVRFEVDVLDEYLDFQYYAEEYNQAYTARILNNG